jgi:glucose dehydrogenase
MQPGAIGGIDWGGASIDPDLGYAITNVVNMPTMIQVTKGKGGVKGNDGYTFSSGYVRFSDSKGRPCSGGRMGELVAVNIATGKIAWSRPLATSAWGGGGGPMGLLSTAGKLLFGNDGGGNFVAYHAATGNPLWHAGLGNNTTNGPQTFLLDGRQYVVVGAGDQLFAFTLQQ